MPHITRPQVSRVLRELLPHRTWTQEDLLRWLRATYPEIEINMSEGDRWVDVARVSEHRDFEPGPVASISLGERALFQFVRRGEFGGVLITGLPCAAAMGSVRLSAADVAIGVSTASFRDLPRVPGRDNLDDVIRALQAVGAAHV